MFRKCMHAQGLTPCSCTPSRPRWGIGRGKIVDWLDFPPTGNTSIRPLVVFCEIAIPSSSLLALLWIPLQDEIEFEGAVPRVSFRIVRYLTKGAETLAE